ncbi:MAG: methylmalonyl-CoA mutase [Candidatus Aminicenantes bacterium]|nr:methylmalonyl-CoA mutase [Candidatus Aminicenantes bacterium]MBL7082794.1 methylmalonyl-CoA mutase [Candidatus Aminicenantes bacterium]
MAPNKKRKDKFSTSSQVKIKKHYKEKERSGFEPSRDLGKPGEYPYTRGIYPTMYRKKFWTMRQYAGFGTAEESNKRYRFLLSQGQTGLSVAFDLPTQLGLDSDHTQAKGEVGKVGVAIDTLQDIETLFYRIPLDKVSVSMTINSTAAIILAMYLALAEKKGIKWKKLSGTIQNDILKEYIARGTYIYPPQASLKIITDILAFCQKNVPQWNTMSISGYHIREAGATAVQELAFTFANALTYVEAAVKAGLDVDTFAPRLSFFLASHNNLFEETAKFRAARRLWARLMREKFQAKNPLSWKFRFHTQTSGATLLAQQPENNVIRVALQALAAVLGGTQSLHTNSRDEALALPSKESAQIALRTQQIIAYESSVADTVDPLGGSYLIESLTNQIEDKVKEYLQKIEELGGMLKAIEKGFIQKEIQESAYKYQRQIENKEQIIVGLNKYENTEEKIQFKLYSPQTKIENTQIKKLQLLKKKRSAKKVKDSLKTLRKAVESRKNILPYTIDAVKAMATLGEISSILKETYGTYNETVNI